MITIRFRRNKRMIRYGRPLKYFKVSRDCKDNRVRSFLLLVFLLSAGVVAPVYSFNYASAAPAESSSPIPLQKIIDGTAPGEEAVLPEGVYEGPVVIKKKLKLRGEGEVTLVNRTPSPAVEIQDEGVEVYGIRIDQLEAGESAAVKVVGDDVRLERLTINTRGYGIMLRDSDNGIIRQNEITWIGSVDTPSDNKGNGIDLYNSHRNRIEENQVTRVRDGIYIENSKMTQITGNVVSQSRYGIHCMYADGALIRGNQGEYNYTGAMIMGVNDSRVIGNTFRLQSSNVNAQGILLYDVHRSVVTGNQAEGNRVGIYVDLSTDNQIDRNYLQRNFLGLQLNKSKNNRFQGNSFIANVLDAVATGSENNRMNGNYWDSFKGLDPDKDGTSDVPYAINPFYQQLIGSNSAYQLFFQSPGMVFLSDLHMNDTQSWLTDQGPRMKPPGSVREGAMNYQGAVLAAGIVMMLGAIYTIKLGVKRHE
ncbi:nitrous oxide reductase family maturation protein NosD [Paenibacillus sp. J22TS3]|uniref:right-handed parallel beta-helix repeat-containing protein n=1 Tax=Paenibacillus sp. J22TS3 TaxID=2807192 RepID=UPI001BCC9467|nr:right-handed parallel beta-helix repeat-containing protein [Paenibacillus sp. J22TS3]